MLPTLVLEQYQSERTVVVSGDRLMYSDHVKCLVALLLILKLDSVLCYKQAPPNTPECIAVGKYSYIIACVIV